MIRNIYSTIKKNPLIFLFLLFYIATLSYKLISSPTFFYDWDESLYIQTGKEMFEKRFFLFPVWQGQPWLDKPPLVPFLYGAIMNIFHFVPEICNRLFSYTKMNDLLSHIKIQKIVVQSVPDEITTRLFTLLISVIVLIFVYILYYKVTKERFIAFLTVMVTAFSPLFLQRSQVVNLDIFLLLGWLGYILFFNRFWLSAFFLMIGVLSKSLLGFYPLILIIFYHLFLFWKKKIHKKEFKKVVRKIVFHFLIALSWFVLMFIVYKQQFFSQHIVESHFKRVTASIESHFGKRTYYIDLIIREMGILIWLVIPGALWLVFQLKKKNFNELKYLYSAYLLPWFIFLNLTKTKIFWYVYPVIPQFAFLSTIPLIFLKKKKIIYYGAGILIFLYVGYTSLVAHPFLQRFYSGTDPHYAIAFFARQYKCESLSVIENPQSRKAYDTLSRLKLIITTTKWWGSHPSLVYYYGGKVHYFYSKNEFISQIPAIFSKKKNCIMIEKTDDEMKAELKKQKVHGLWQFEQYLLFRPDKKT